MAAESYSFEAGPAPPGADLFCPSCGEVLPILGELQARLAEAESLIATQAQQMSEYDAELRVKRSQISRLRSEQAHAREASPHAADATEVFNYWKDTLSPRAREFSGDRFDHVVARLRAGHTVAELKQAVDGAKAKPRGGSGAGTDLTTICRNEANLLMFIGFAEAAAKAPTNGGHVASRNGGPLPSSYEEAVHAKHEEANRWRSYAHELHETRPAVAQRIYNAALVLDTNEVGDPRNGALVREMRELIPT